MVYSSLTIKVPNILNNFIIQFITFGKHYLNISKIKYIFILHFYKWISEYKSYGNAPDKHNLQ